MPVSTYTHYQDPTTGKTIMLPQLFPHATCSGTMSSKDIENLVDAGIMPREVYESDNESRKKMEEVHKRILKGEKVLSNELPSKPWALTEYLIKNKCSIYGEQVLKQIFSNLEESDPDIVWLSFIKEAITSISSQDPLPIHFFIAKNYLKEELSIEEPTARDMLARKIVEHCHIIKNFKIFNHRIFESPTITPDDLREHFEHESGGILSIDFEYLRYIESLGPAGKKTAKEAKEKCAEIFEYYKKENYPNNYRNTVWSLWTLNKKDEKLFPPFLSIIAKVSWNESCSKTWDRQAKQTPAITKPIIETIKPILNPNDKKKFVSQNDNIICVGKEGQPLFIAPAIDANLINLHKKGVKWISTLTGHRLLRWQIKTGFERWSSGETDPRTVIIDGGYSHIAQLAGCPSLHDIAKVKAILYAQTYGEFIFPDGSRGNMISLNIKDTYKNGEPSRIIMTLGDMLLPNYVFRIENRSDRRLIPIGNLPPLHGSKNTHAKQAHLQLLVLEEFSNQSKKLAERGYVVIPIDRWKEMAAESGLDPSKVESIINYWQQPDFVNCFLDKQGDEYRLASYYEDAQKFLVHQGKQRVSNSKRGKASVIAKEKAKKKAKSKKS